MIMGNPKAKELDVVKLTEDLPQYGLCMGEQGTIVEVFSDPEEAYMIEFQQNLSGNSIIADWVLPTQLETLDVQSNQQPFHLPA
jgi:hypothetical protein